MRALATTANAIDVNAGMTIWTTVMKTTSVVTVPRSGFQETRCGHHSSDSVIRTAATRIGP
jgi:hypothetical protein